MKDELVKKLDRITAIEESTLPADLRGVCRKAAEKLTWVPTTDYLPPCHQLCLVTIENGARFIGYVAIDGGNYVWKAMVPDVQINVKAWMPLPDPYEG